MNRWILFYLALFITSLIFSQEDKKLIEGYIHFDNYPLKDVHIFNKTSKIGTITNELGEFKILIKKNDILLISHINFKNKEIIISDKEVGNNAIVISMKDRSHILEEVFIKRHYLKGSLSIDVSKTPRDKPQELVDKMMLDIKNLKFKNIINMPIGKDESHLSKVAAPSIPIFFQGAGVSATIPDKSLEKKRALRRKISYKERFPKLLLSDFTPEFFFKELKIPKENYYHFLEYCNPLGIEKLYKNQKIFELIKILQIESKSYLKIIKKK